MSQKYLFLSSFRYQIIPSNMQKLFLSQIQIFFNPLVESSQDWLDFESLISCCHQIIHKTTKDAWGKKGCSTLMVCFYLYFLYLHDIPIIWVCIMFVCIIYYTYMDYVGSASGSCISIFIPMRPYLRTRYQTV